MSAGGLATRELEMHPPIATSLNKLVLVFAETDSDHASDTFDTVASIEASTETKLNARLLHHRSPLGELVSPDVLELVGDDVWGGRVRKLGLVRGTLGHAVKEAALGVCGVTREIQRTLGWVERGNDLLALGIAATLWLLSVLESDTLGVSAGTAR